MESRHTGRVADAWHCTFAAPLWRWDETAWHFVTLPEDVSDEIADLTAGQSHGFGSVRVEVTIGTTTWRTSLFPSKERAAYVLPMKKAVRSAQGLSVGEVTDLSITLIEH